MALTKITPQMFDTSATAHDLNVDNGTFVVDGSASRVGIGTATPSTLLDVNGTATATTFVGALTGNVTGNVSGTAATVTGAAQTNITSLGTLTTLTVDNITIDGNEIDSTSGHIVLDSADEIKLDSHNGIIRVQTQGGDIGMIRALNSDLQIRSMVADKDIVFYGNDSDGGGGFTALTLDMSAVGAATFAGPVLAPAGSASIPSLSFSGDPNTGLYSVAGDNIGFAIGGSARAFLSATQFNMTGNIVATSSIKLNGQTSSDGLRLDLAGSTDYKIGETSTNDIVAFGAAGGAATHLIHHNISSGHVGIGTASPAALLDVGGGNVADPTIRIDSASGGDPTLIFDASQANRSARIKFYDNGSAVGGFIDYLHNGDKMNFGAGSSANATMTVGDGKVGIGTDSPGRLLTLFNNDQPVFQITNNTSGTASTRGLIMYQATGSTTSIIDNQGSGSGGAIQFYRAGSLSLGISATGTIYTAANGIIESASSAGSLTISGGSTNKGGQILLRGGNGDSDIVFKAQASTATPTERVRINSTGLIIKDSSFIFDKPSVYGFRFLHNDAGNDLSIQIGDANNANYRSLANFDSNGLNINYTNNNTNMSRLRLGRNCLDDCYVFFNSGAGAGDWSLGTDYSDSSKFKLSRTSTPGNGNNIFEIGTGGDMAFNVHLTPYTTNTYDLGTSTVRWRNIYSQDLHLSNEDTGGNDVDGTEGNWTIQEGEEDLYIINNKTGKKFRFALEEIT